MPKLSNSESKPRRGQLLPWHYAVLALPYVGLLTPALYARATPELFGLPFFYWYQFAWVLLSAALTGLVYWRTRGTGRA